MIYWSSPHSGVQPVSSRAAARKSCSLWRATVDLNSFLLATLDDVRSGMPFERIGAQAASANGLPTHLNHGRNINATRK